MILTHDRPHFLELALNSVLVQTYRKFEIVISDNWHSSASRDVLETFMERVPRISQHKLPGVGPLYRP
ncbi:glycosyltransferase family A protein [Roseateles oligotrophus]|uniref:Glycosyltransferase family 2 protein n=1 Tax=Roseateles oligotrophus TaxID=1769250 RepID=A0ABT2YMT1_9BURK|nr:glycosyltransferase family A protein [Roseateles oligotrophus]MCV2371185.1 glycosyltransferase family 2 protein [Roseateles oligotrophus]